MMPFMLPPLHLSCQPCLLRVGGRPQPSQGGGRWVPRCFAATLPHSRTRTSPLCGAPACCWLRHNLKVSLRRNKPLRVVLSYCPPVAVVLLDPMLIFTAGDAVNPVAVVQIPLDRL